MIVSVQLRITARDGDGYTAAEIAAAARAALVELCGSSRLQLQAPSLGRKESASPPAFVYGSFQFEIAPAASVAVEIPAATGATRRLRRSKR